MVMDRIDEYLWLFDQRMRVRDTAIRKLLQTELDNRFLRLQPSEKLFADIRRQRMIVDYGREIGVFEGTLKRRA